MAQGDLATADELLQLSAVHQRWQRFRRSIAWTNLARAEPALALGDERYARTLLEEARAEMEILGEPGGRDGCAAVEARLQALLSSS